MTINEAQAWISAIRESGAEMAMTISGEWDAYSAEARRTLARARADHEREEEEAWQAYRRACHKFQECPSRENLDAMERAYDFAIE